MTVPQESLDPARHLLSLHDAGWGQDGAVVWRAITLHDAAAQWQRLLDGARATESMLRFADDETNLALPEHYDLSTGRAAAMAGMLFEFAMRMWPGTAVGPIQSDDAPSQLAHELSLRLHREWSIRRTLQIPRDRDPSRHLLSQQPTAAGQPPALDELVPQWRDLIERGDDGAISDLGQGITRMSRQRALVVGELLAEFAVRLTPGLAVGPIRSDGSLGAFARDVARDMFDRAHLPAPPWPR